MIKQKVMLSFPKNITKEPIAYVLVKDYDIRISILRANINYNIEGKLLLEIEGNEKQLADGIAYLKSLGIKVSMNATCIEIDYKKCVHCGACTAACTVHALSIIEGELIFDSNKCMECMLCQKACPKRIIKNMFE